MIGPGSVGTVREEDREEDREEEEEEEEEEEDREEGDREEGRTVGFALPYASYGYGLRTFNHCPLSNYLWGILCNGSPGRQQDTSAAVYPPPHLPSFTLNHVC